MSIEKDTSRSLLAQFASLDAATRTAIADLKSPLKIALCALDIAKERFQVDGLTAEHMVAALEEAGTAASRSALIKALYKAGGRVTKRPGPEGSVYRIMLPGHREADRLLSQGDIQLLRFDGLTPRSARQKMAQLLATLSGLVRISDPYYGQRTLDLLDSVSRQTEVRFLTGRSSENASKFASALKDFKTEHPRVHFRLARNPGDLHDRYLLTQDTLFIVGHGLKDLGTKESFVICIDNAIALDLVAESTKTFDLRWQTATDL